MSDQKLVRIMCPNLTCRKVLSIPEVARGKTVRCKTCGTNIRIPSNKTAPANKTEFPSG
jgi:RNase P subunit RPR2